MWNRRQLLHFSAVGFPLLALRGLLDQQARADIRDPLAPRLGHHAPRAKRILFLFMKGGPSQVDTFDHKPRLQRDHGKPLPFDKPRVQFAPTGKLLGSPWSFSRYGECGLPVSELPSRLIASGFRINGIQQEQVNLETAFMRLTKGIVS